jgi:fucose permease
VGGHGLQHAVEAGADHYAASQSLFCSGLGGLHTVSRQAHLMKRPILQQLTLVSLPPGLINSLTGQLQSGSGYNSAQGIILHNTYYCGYIIGPLAAYYIFTRVGFKATFITGLAVFTIATLSFWPSSSLVSFPGFSVSNILIGSGLAILQVAANPYVALAGPDELMESRLNFARGFQAIGQMVSPLLAIKVLFKRVGRPGLFSSQWLYLAISLSASLLGVVFYYVPLCEASNDDLELVASRREIRKGISKQAHVWRINIMLVVAIAGIFGMWLYIGAQEQLRYFWNDLMAEVKPG